TPGHAGGRRTAVFPHDATRAGSFAPQMTRPRRCDSPGPRHGFFGWLVAAGAPHTVAIHLGFGLRLLQPPGEAGIRLADPRLGRTAGHQLLGDQDRLAILVLDPDIADPVPAGVHIGRLTFDDHRLPLDERAVRLGRFLDVARITGRDIDPEVAHRLLHAVDLDHDRLAVDHLDDRSFDELRLHPLGLA